jgi:hypothetical protein
MTTNTNPTPAQLRAQADAHDQAAADSFDRSDTDGFLSQWASNMTALKLRAEADLAEAGGMIETRALFNLDGTVASTHLHYGQYGAAWVLNDDAAARFGKRFFKDSHAQKASTRKKNNRARGFTIGMIRVKGRVEIAGSGTGLSGAASARVVTVPVIAELKAGNFEIVTADRDEEDWS